MDIDGVLTLASLVSFFALVVTWVAAPLRAPAPSLVSEAAQPIAA
jgi:hypothetical protein